MVSSALCVVLTAFCQRRQEKPLLHNVNTHLPGLKLKNKTHKERVVQQVLVKYPTSNKTPVSKNEDSSLRSNNPSSVLTAYYQFRFPKLDELKK